MAIQINNGFNLKASIPLDSRFVFQDMADLNAMPVHELYIGLLTYVIEKQAFYVYNGATFEEFKSKSDYFLDPVETAANLSSIQSPKKGAVCLVKDEKRFYTYVGDTTVTGTVTTGEVTTVTNDTSIPMTVSLIFADNPEVSDEFPASIDLSNAAQVIDNYVDGWAPVTCKAIEIAYDNTTSNLKADNIQAAIDELVSLIEEAPSPIPPVPTPGDLPDPSDSKPGDIVVVKNPKTIYVFDGDTWVEIKAENEYFLNPVETSSALSSIPSPKKGAVCLVKDENKFYTCITDTLAGDITDWKVLSYKAAEISYNNATSNLQADNVQKAIDELTTLFEETPSPIPPVSTPGDLPETSDSKPGDIVVVQNPKSIYVFDGSTWIEINARSEYYLDPVETKANLQLDPLPSYGTVCMVKNEGAFYVYVNATFAELNGQPAQDAWICTKTKAEDIPFDNTDTGLTGTTVNEVINEINTTVIERTILDWPDDPTTVAIGGIEAGYQTPVDGINVAEFLYMMTHPFVYPTLTLTLTPPAGIYEKNTQLTFSKAVVGSSTGTKPAFEEQEPKIYVNNSEVTTTDTTSVSSDKMTYIREFTTPQTISGTSDVTVKAEVKLNGKTLKSETAYKFVYAMYIGSIEAAIISSFQNDLFISSNKLVVEKSNQVATYTHDDKLTAFAYPASYGDLSQILDQNGFDISSAFSLTSYVYNSVQYRVYYSNNKSTVTNFKISYKF